MSPELQQLMNEAIFCVGFAAGSIAALLAYIAFEVTR